MIEFHVRRVKTSIGGADHQLVDICSSINVARQVATYAIDQYPDWKVYIIDQHEEEYPIHVESTT